MSTTKQIIYSLNIENNSNIHEKVYDTHYQSYSILYTDTDECEGKYHSVIYEYPTRRLLSFAPPKNPELSVNEFLAIYKKDSTNNSMYINEFVEGTFIHLFYDTRISSWEIATKRAIGGNYSYFHIPGKDNITYREMILEAFRESIDMCLNDLSFLELLPKNNCYSFVLQHPSNHIVIPIYTPKMYLVSIYEIDKKILDIMESLILAQDERWRYA
jgi:hypothetical protein